MQAGHRRSFRAFSFTSAVLPWLLACSSASNAGGSAHGGASANTGGSIVTAGTSNDQQGGSIASGGTSPAAGGQVSTGGMHASSAGGSGGSGGTSVATGGSLGVAGSSAPGGGGAAPTASLPSAGCGKAAGLMNGRASIDVSGTMREYILALPTNYDQSKPYRLIFGWHPWGGSAQQVASGGYYGLQKQSNGTAIFVAAEGLDFGGNGLGWGNQNGQDIALLNAMLDRFRSQLCIDENRIFSVGFSFGGMFSFAAGCSANSMMRAIAPMAGNTTVAGCDKSSTRPVAMMGFHGTDDQVVAIDGGRQGRDIFAQRNGCSQQTVASQPTWCDVAGQNYQPCTCVNYQGCKDGYPVTWCEYKGPHMQAPNSGATVWNFFAQF
ncbi:MAG TPA: Ricin and poly(3-hydroxybutyrate) depolymerase fusion [Polyangiaceae bacterium]|nr:Ricin and poly(3-hydroxybutyrate) depolymerase fusion [Polyangiaceae bacterium]